MDKVLKSILKVGMKMLAPVSGEVLAMAVEEIGGLGIDRWQADRVRKIHDRMLTRMRQELEWLERLEGIPSARLESIASTVTRMLDRYGLSLEEWVQRGWNAKDAVEEVLQRASDLRPELDGQDGEQIALRLLTAFYSALGADRAALDETESDFRSTVLARIGCAEGGATAAQVEAMLGLPTSPARLDLMTSDALLRADSAAPVPFHGRGNEIADLVGWCGADEPFGLRLYHGPGGRGKTRLMRQLCRELRVSGWRAGFLADEARKASASHWRSLLASSKPLLVVIDYAENGVDVVGALLAAFLRSKMAIKLRVVLLARGHDDWWLQLRRAPDGVGELVKGPKSAAVELCPLATDAAARRESFLQAARHFARLLGAAVPPVPDIDWEAGHFQQVLLLHVMALGAVEGVDVTQTEWPKEHASILDWVIDREVRLWEKMAKARDLPKDIWPAIELVMAVISLGGGAPMRETAMEVARRIPLLRGQPESVLSSLVGLLHEAYPGRKWIEKLQPDLLTEHLQQTRLWPHPDYELFYDMVFGRRDG